MCAFFSIIKDMFSLSKRKSCVFLIIVLIGSITLAVGKLAVSLFDLWAKDQEKGFPSTTMFTNFVRIAIYVIGVLIILDSLNI